MMRYHMYGVLKEKKRKMNNLKSTDIQKLKLNLFKLYFSNNITKTHSGS